MAYPITGELGKVNSVTNSTDLDQVLEVATKQNEITYTIDGDQEDVSGDGATSSQFISGLRAWSFDFTAKWPKTTPRYGHTGLVSRASGDTQSLTYIESWTMNFDFGEEDITAFDGTSTTNPSWRSFRPSGRPVISGTFTIRAPNDAALSLPTVAVSGSGMTGAFRLATETTNHPSFTGTIKVKSLGTTFGGKGLVLGRYAYTFDGAVTSVAGDSLAALLPAGTVDASNWGDGTTGPDTVQVVTQSVTSRTYTGYGYLRTLAVSVAVGAPVQVTGTVKGQGVLTLA